MSTENLTEAQLSACLTAENALGLIEIYGPLAAQGHQVDWLTVTQECANARQQIRQSLYNESRKDTLEDVREALGDVFPLLTGRQS